MLMNHKNLFVVLLIAALSTGCASMKPAQYNTSQSSALNLGIAAGFTEANGPLTDVKVDVDYYEYGTADLASTGYIAMNGVGTYGISAGSVQSLFSAGFILNLLSNSFIPAANDHWFGWIPESDVGDADARSRVTDIWIDAYAASLPDGYRLEKHAVWKSNLWGSYVDDVYFIVGGVCHDVSNPTLLREGALDIDLSSTDYCNVGYIKGKGDIEMATAPAWIGGYKSYAFGVSNVDNVVNRINLLVAPGSITQDPVLGDIAYEEFLVAISSKLPEWFYYYSAPKKDTSSMPMILSSGKALVFVDPTSHQTVTSR